jgi:hypothetical protein
MYIELMIKFPVAKFNLEVELAKWQKMMTMLPTIFFLANAILEPHTS